MRMTSMGKIRSNVRREGLARAVGCWSAEADPALISEETTTRREVVAD